MMHHVGAGVFLRSSFMNKYVFKMRVSVFVLVYLVLL